MVKTYMHCIIADNTGARVFKWTYYWTKSLYKGLVKVGESADGGDNYGISNQLRLSLNSKGEKKIHCC
jgi:hypothetical protein